VDKATQQIEVVRKSLKTTQDWQKQYVDWGTRPLKFAIGDLIYLQATPSLLIFRHQGRGKLGPQY